MSAVLLHTSWQVGNVLDINVWTDSWLDKPVVDILNIPSELHSNLKSKVSDFITDGSWQIPNSLMQKFPALCNEWQKIITPNEHVPDRRVWSSSDSGTLTLKDAKMFLNPIGNVVNWFYSIWQNCMIRSQLMIIFELEDI